MLKKCGGEGARSDKYADMKMKNVFRATLSVLAMVGSAAALEVTDIPAEVFSREYADAHFTKDYEYRLLEDNSVRRTWKVDGYTLIVDFDIRSSKVICVFVDYEPAVSRSVAMEHARHLVAGRSEGVRWVNTRSEAVQRVGLPKARRFMELTDGSYIFWESNSERANNCDRLCWFASKPRADRMAVGSLVATSGRTALGSTSVTGVHSSLKADEERRREIQPRPVEVPQELAMEDEPAATPEESGSATAQPTPTPRPATPRPAAPRPAEPRPATPSPVAPSPAPAAPAPESTPVSVPAAEEAEPASNVLALIGIKVEDRVVHYILGGVGVLLLIIIWNAISASRRRARQAAQFEALLNGDDKDDK